MVSLVGKCATPVITVAVSESSGKPVLTWEKISGAKKYTVYYATSVTGKVGENKKPVITWAEVEGATKYIVYRSTSKSKNYKVIGETEAPTYEDLTAAKSKTYYYKVVAVGDGFQSAQSGYAKVKSK